MKSATCLIVNHTDLLKGCNIFDRLSGLNSSASKESEKYDIVMYVSEMTGDTVIFKNRFGNIQNKFGNI